MVYFLLFALGCHLRSNADISCEKLAFGSRLFIADHLRVDVLFARVCAESDMPNARISACRTRNFVYLQYDVVCRFGDIEHVQERYQACS